MSGFFASLLPSLGLLFSFIFMWSNNAFMFSPQGIIVSFMIILLFSIVIFCINYWIIPRIIHIFICDKWHFIILCLYLSVIFTILFACVVDYRIYNQRRVYAPIILCILFFALYFKKEKVLGIFLGLMLCFSSIILIKHSVDENEIILDKTYSGIELKKKPNIYLYWLESYHDFDVLKKMYNIDNNEYKKYLLDKGFTIKNNIFSSGHHTLLAFSQLYSYALCENITKGTFDIGRNYRNLIGGDKNNIIFRVLKENGYKTFLLADSYYYLYQKGKYLDEVNLNLNNVYILVYPIIYIMKNDIRNFFIPEVNVGNGYKGTLSDQVRTAMMRGKSSGKPYIIAFKGGAEHTPPEGYTWKERETWISNGRYQNLIRRSDAESEEIINYILENDPDAMIILLGDHGSWTYRGFPWENSENYAKYNVREEDVFDDIFRVLFAYRLPNGAQDDISHGMYMNNVNIFTHIFAYLAEDLSLLEERTQSVSVLPGSRTRIVEGKIVKE